MRSQDTIKELQYFQMQVYSVITAGTSVWYARMPKIWFVTFSLCNEGRGPDTFLSLSVSWPMMRKCLVFHCQLLPKWGRYVRCFLGLAIYYNGRRSKTTSPPPGKVYSTSCTLIYVVPEGWTLKSASQSRANITSRLPDWSVTGWFVNKSPLVPTGSFPFVQTV